jgi:rubrerythrin
MKTKVKRDIGEMWKDGKEWVVQFPKGILAFNRKGTALQWQAEILKMEKLKNENAEVEEVKNKICPRCNVNELHEEDVMNSLSRRDNKTYICSECGVAEAMEDFIAGQKRRAEKV